MMRAVLLTIVMAGAPLVLAPAIAATSSAPAMTLSAAIKAGDRATALRLINKRAATTAEPDGTTPLHYAASREDVDLVQRLLRAGANAKAKNQYGSTPLAEAAASGNAQIIKLLLRAGADPESPNGEGQTALMLVARTANVDAAELLIKAGANVNAREGWKEQTPLMWAAAQRQPAMVKLLIQSGAEVDARSKIHDWQRQVTAEPRAVFRPVGGLTPLLFAAREGCQECVAALLDAKADINLGDPEEIAPLLVSIINAHWDLASYLIDRGADIQKWDYSGRTPLYAAVDLNTIPHGGRPDGPTLDTTTSFQIIQKLLDKGANPNAQLKLLPPLRSLIDDRAMDNQLIAGATPLLRAAKAFDAPVIALLLQHGAKVDLPNSRGMTPFMVAAGLGSTDADSRGTYVTPDVQERSIGSLKLLLAAGAEINRHDGGRGLTALHEASRWGWNDVVKYLVANGADIDAKDRKGMTPIDSALGKAGGNSRFGQRIDVYEKTAQLLRDLKAAKAAGATIASTVQP